MDFYTIVVVLMVGIAVGLYGALLVVRSRVKESKGKPKAKASAGWLTRRQLEVLLKIAETGKTGIQIWHTDINVATMRSLCKRGFADTASNGRLIATRSGRRRLLEPWPTESSQVDQKPGAGSNASDVDQLGGQGEAEEA